MQSKYSFSKIIPYLLTILILIADFNTEFGYAVGILYTIPIIIIGFQRRQKILIPFAIFCCLLVLLYFLISADTSSKLVLFNRLISCTGILGITIIFYFQERILNATITKSYGIEKQADIVLNQIEDHSIILLNKEGIINSWNVGSTIMFGYSPQDILGKNISILFNIDHSESNNFHNLKLQLDKQEKVDKNVWLKRKNGAFFLAEISLQELQKKNGDNIGIAVSINDVDKKRSLEQMLTATNSLAKVGGWEYDLITDELVWSSTTHEIHEVEPDYVPNTTEGIKFYKEGKDRDTISRVFSKMVEDGTPFEEELRIITATNKEKWVRSKAYPIFLNNKCVKIYGSFQDIDEVKRKDIIFRESEEKFRKTFEFSPNGMARVSTVGKVIQANKSYYDLVGYTQEELNSLTINEITHPEDRAQDKKMFTKLNCGEVESFELDKRLYTKSHDLKWVHIAVSRIINSNGKTEYYIAQLTDITKRKEAENQLVEQKELLIEKNNELNQYVYITSHDLQEPVRTINSFTTLLNQSYSDRLDDKGQKYIRFINEASVRLRDQIKGLLDFSRLGKNEKTAESTDCNNVLKNIKSDINTLIEEQNAQINYEELPTLNTFPTEFKLLLQNLIINAIKFKKADHTPIVNIRATEEKSDWKFVVEDNGIGIEERFTDKIFLIFQRLHARKDYEGSGIGLAHCKKVVEMHQGKIWVESKLGEGSKFYFTIKKEL